MKNSRFPFFALSAATLLALAACGGGGGDSASNAPVAPATPVVTPPPPTVTVTGTAPAVSVDPLAVVFVPPTETSTHTTQQSIAWNNFPAALQKVSSEGAYTTLGVDANSLITLSSGKVVDVSGNGSFSLGRWTDGASNLLGSINSNQGAHYVVGRPLTLTQTPGPAAKLSCNLLASTSPTAVSGNFSAGKVNSASATINLNGPGIDAFTIDLAIGSDPHATGSVTGTTINGLTISSGIAHHVQVMGSDAANPYLAIGYSMPTPSSGDVSGVVVLKCSAPVVS